MALTESVGVSLALSSRSEVSSKSSRGMPGGTVSPEERRKRYRLRRRARAAEEQARLSPSLGAGTEEPPRPDSHAESLSPERRRLRYRLKRRGRQEAAVAAGSLVTSEVLSPHRLEAARETEAGGMTEAAITALSTPTLVTSVILAPLGLGATEAGSSPGHAISLSLPNAVVGTPEHRRRLYREKRRARARVGAAAAIGLSSNTLKLERRACRAKRERRSYRAKVGARAAEVGATAALPSARTLPATAPAEGAIPPVIGPTTPGRQACPMAGAEDVRPAAGRGIVKVGRRKAPDKPRGAAGAPRGSLDGRGTSKGPARQLRPKRTARMRREPWNGGQRRRRKKKRWRRLEPRTAAFRRRTQAQDTPRGFVGASSSPQRNLWNPLCDQQGWLVRLGARMGVG
jgi:hypothetical protein